MVRMSDIVIGLFLIITITVHLLRIIYLLFKPESLSKYKSISDTNLKPHKLILYYSLVIIVALYVLFKRINS